MFWGWSYYVPSFSYKLYNKTDVSLSFISSLSVANIMILLAIKKIWYVP